MNEPTPPSRRGARATLLVLTVFGLSACGSGDAGVACSSDAACSALDDGDPCNGSFACTGGTCAFDPSTVVSCDATGDTPCARNLCDPADGQCKVRPTVAGTPCEDGQPCTLGDTCKDGACQAGGTNACACTKTADCADDGDLCNGTPLCDTSTFPYRCVTNPATAVTCKDDTDPCTAATCDPKTGTCSQQPVADGGSCDDGDACTSGDVCVGGTCKGGTDTCACSKDSDCAGQEDGDLCNGTLYCDTSGGTGTCKTNPKTVVTCATKADTACRKNTCQKATGTCALVSVTDGAACDDGEACTKNDTCVGGGCVGGTDICACTKDSDCAGQEDGDLCNGTLYCDKKSGKCLVNDATKVVCQTAQDTDCSKTVCLPKTGKCAALARKDVVLLGCVKIDLGGLIGEQCKYAPAKAPQTGVFPCDDGDACTSAEVCEGQTCKAGKVTCECKKDSDCDGKDDGDLCNGTWFCDQSVGKCKANPGSVVYCSKKDDTACLKAACNPKSGACGLQPVAAKTGCDDGQVCTVDDTCDGKGSCGGKPNPCDDKDPCTTDSCGSQGCTHKAKVCDDGNSCTTEACDPKSGQCTAPKAQPKGAGCNADGDGCTAGDACDGKGSCTAGAKVQCKAPADPCKNAVCVSSGTSGFSCAEVAKADKASCDLPGACKVGAQCLAGKCQPGTQDTLYAETLIGPTDGYTSLRAVVAMADGDVVVGGQRRAKASAPASANEAFVARYGVLGKTQQWQIALKPGSPDAHAGVVGAAAAPADGVVVVASLLDKSQVRGAQVVRLSGAGKTLWSKRLDPLTDKNVWGFVKNGVIAGTEAAVPLGLDVAPDGSVVVLLAEKRKRVNFKKQQVVLDAARMDFLSPVGQPGQRVVDVPHLVDDFYDFENVGGQVRFAGSTVAVAGTWWKGYDDYTGTFYGYPSMAYVADVSGKLVDRATGYWGKDAAGRLMHRDAAGRRVDLLAHVPKGAAKAVVRVGVEAGGETRSYEGELSHVPFALAPVADGRNFVLGTLAGGKAQVVQMMDHRGNGHWLKTVADGTTDRATALDVTPDERVVVVGEHAGSGGVTRGRITRLSGWGHASCSGAGVCEKTSWKSCDDAKVCTQDHCDATLGCTHATTVALNCDVTNGCSASATCDAGVCKPSANGVIAEIPIDFGAGTNVLTVCEGRVFPLIPALPGNGDPPDTSFATLQCNSSTKDTISMHGPTGEPSVLLNGPFALGATADLRFRGRAVAGKGTSSALVSATRKSGSYTQAVFGAGTGSTPKAAGCASSACQSEGRDLLEGVDGQLWSVSRTTTPLLGAQLLIERRSDKMAKLNQALVALDAKDHDYVDGAARADGGVALLLFKPGAGGRDGEVRTYDHKGAASWAATVATARDDVPGAIVSTPAGGAFVVGRSQLSDKLHAGWIARVSPAGKVLWNLSPAGLDGRSYTSAVLDGDRLIVGGATAGGGKLVGFVGAVAWDGEWLIERSFSQLYSPGTALTRTKSGQLFLTTFERRPVKKGQYTYFRSFAWLYRLSPWLHPSCTAAGTCSDKQAKDCDDGNPCTVDLCDAKKGCVHTVADGAPCGTGKVCGSGKCVAAP